MKTGIYVHVPFCVSKCFYCDFCSYTNKSFTQYVDAVIKEIGLRAPKEKVKIDTIYFGGGTPTLLDACDTGKILAEIRKRFAVDQNAEITIECNPASATKEKIAELVSLGFNRFSVGLQSDDDNILKALNRPHNVQDFVDTVSAIRQFGIKNISCDIMLELPYQRVETVNKTLDLIEKMQIPHVSAYALKVERGTPLAKKIKCGEITLPDEDFCADMYEVVLSRLKKLDIHRYEVSNFAKKGFECEHNLIYWRLLDYYGFGPSAHGFINGTRYANVKSLVKYYEKTSSGIKPQIYSKKQTLDDNIFDYAMLAFRLNEGLDTTDFYNQFGINFETKYPKILILTKKGFFEKADNKIKVTDKYFYMLNEILVELLFE
ncbi:MAG TPA: radical SAM family heme chaperone HemW [Clostridia bacterium]|nr:radical SAM family heme chaperone HemW [Clostridia bacterium]